jgi:hypothetical protein
MDPITSAIVAALSAGAVGKVGEMAFMKAYETLKASIRQKFGRESKVAGAVAVLEDAPDFKPNQETLAGRIRQVNAAEDNDLLQLAEALTAALQQTDEGKAALKKYRVTIQGSQVGFIGDNATVKGGIHFGKK